MIFRNICIHQCTTRSIPIQKVYLYTGRIFLPLSAGIRSNSLHLYSLYFPDIMGIFMDDLDLNEQCL